VLRGSKNKKLLARGHDRLSTYGIGRDYSTAEWKRLAQHFIQQGLLKQDMTHGGVSLTSAAWEVLRGNEQVFVVAPSAIRQAGPEAADYDKILFEQLRKLRKTLADAEGAPPYMVFSDRALVEMATYFPQSIPAFMAINGVGEVKMGKYGQPFLDAIRTYCGEQGIPERAKSTGPRLGSPTSRGDKRRFEEVGELFIDGRSVAELQDIYGVKRGTIINHLTTYLRAGGDVDAQRVRAASTLSQVQQEQVLTALDELGAGALRPVFDAFDGVISFDELHIMRLYYLCAADGAEG
jgi:ATP-dependent DNA helicase RecQ